jgi:hypothetical protein
MNDASGLLLLNASARGAAGGRARPTLRHRLQHCQILQVDN